MSLFLPERRHFLSNRLPETGFVRLSQILGDPKAEPPIPAVIPVGKSTWWEGVKTGRFPKPVKLGPRITAWRVEDIRALIERGGEQSR
jgi:prophage regulatory protein